MVSVWFTVMPGAPGHEHIRKPLYQGPMAFPTVIRTERDHRDIRLQEARLEPPQRDSKRDQILLFWVVRLLLPQQQAVEIRYTTTPLPKKVRLNLPCDRRSKKRLDCGVNSDAAQKNERGGSAVEVSKDGRNG